MKIQLVFVACCVAAAAADSVELPKELMEEYNELESTALTYESVHQAREIWKNQVRHAAGAESSAQAVVHSMEEDLRRHIRDIDQASNHWFFSRTWLQPQLWLNGGCQGKVERARFARRRIELAYPSAVQQARDCKRQLTAAEEELKIRERHLQHVQSTKSRREAIFMEINTLFPSIELERAVQKLNLVETELRVSSEQLHYIERSHELHNDGRRQLETARLKLVRAESRHETYKRLCVRMEQAIDDERAELEESLGFAKQDYVNLLDDAQRNADQATQSFRSAQRIMENFHDPIQPQSKSNGQHEDQDLKHEKVAGALSDVAPYIGLLLTESKSSSKAKIVSDMIYMLSQDSPSHLTSPPTYTADTIELEIRRLQRCDRSSRDQQLVIEDIKSKLYRDTCALKDEKNRLDKVVEDERVNNFKALMAKVRKVESEKNRKLHPNMEDVS